MNIQFAIKEAIKLTQSNPNTVYYVYRVKPLQYNVTEWKDANALFTFYNGEEVIISFEKDLEAAVKECGRKDLREKMKKWDQDNL